MDKYDEIIKVIEELENKINELPKGYISKKKIYGRVRSYLQWQEDHKKKSKYISDIDVPKLIKEINSRRVLQAKVKELKANLPLIIFKNDNKYKLKTNIRIGNSLNNFISIAKKYKRRDCFEIINNYLYKTNLPKVLILYGLRRTGKTTLIRQAILDMKEEDRNKTAFIQIGSKDNLANVNEDLKYLESKGYKYVFIDEVTLMNDFIEGAALFPDIFVSSGMKIILSGTDSLGFIFAEDNQLYDRCIMLHTTFISYSEFERVLGIKGIDEYIRYGGTMSISGNNYNEFIFATKNSTNEYLDSSIANNIQHSLKRYQYEGHFRNLIDLYTNKELTNVINRVVEDINHRFTLEVLTKDFVSNDLKISSKNLRNDGNNILDKIDITKVTNRLKQLLDIKNKDELKIKIKQEHRLEIEEYLKVLDLIDYMNIYSISSNIAKNKRIVFTQPGIRYAIAKAFIESLLLDEKIQNISILERKYILERILNEIKGRMMEDIVLLETKIKKPKYDVFKLQFDVGEFDMVIFDKEKLTSEIYEIKHSKTVLKEQYKNLINKDKCDKTEFKYGKITKKCVIYRGNNLTSKDGIKFINVEDYLNNL